MQQTTSGLSAALWPTAETAHRHGAVLIVDETHGAHLTLTDKSSLPDRKGTTNGIAQLLFDASSSNKSKVLATNGSNATNKNWKVQYFGDDADITGFTGTKQTD